MLEHDLEDLVIGDNEKRDNKKGKGILTILALLIAILIIVIMMAKMVMGENDKEKNLGKTEQQESLISPELQLDDEEKSPKSDDEKLNDITAMIDENKDKPSPKNEIKENTVEVNDDETKEKKPPVVKKPKVVEEKPKEVEKPKPVVEKRPKPKPVEKPKPKPTPKPKPKPEPKPQSHISNGSYYIQVGSFANKPSSRFLSVITNSGFSYKLHHTGKLLIGSYSSRANANRDLPRVKDLINKSAFVIKIK